MQFLRRILPEKRIVKCDNGVAFVDVDKWDTVSLTWIEHHGDSIDYDGRHVTHWQPLPAPPDEGGKCSP